MDFRRDKSKARSLLHEKGRIGIAPPKIKLGAPHKRDQINGIKKFHINTRWLGGRAESRSLFLKLN